MQIPIKESDQVSGPSESLELVLVLVASKSIRLHVMFMLSAVTHLKKRSSRQEVTVLFHYLEQGRRVFTSHFVADY